MQRITENTVVAFHCDTLDLERVILQSTRGLLPYLYVFGDSTVPKALQQAMIGLGVGDRMDVSLSAEHAYGPYDHEWVQTLPIEALPEGRPLCVGDKIMAHMEEGDRPVRIVEINDKTVTVDGNHPLSGKDVIFDIEIRHVRLASAREIATGKID